MVDWRILSVSVLALMAAPAGAAPLDAEICAKIKGDVVSLEADGFRDLFQRGPQARAGLNATQLQKIKLLMDLDGQLRFRCSGEAPFVALREEPPDDPSEAAALSAGIDRGTPGVTLPAEPTVAPIRPDRPAAKAAGVPVPAQPKAVSPPKATAAVKGAPETGASAVADQPAVGAKRPPAPAAVTPVVPSRVKPKVDDAFRPPTSEGGPAQQ